MKKTLMFALIALTAGFAFAGGGKQQDGSSASGGGAPKAEVSVNADGTINNPEDVQTDPNKLVFWSLFSGGDGGYMDKIIAEYNKTNPAKQVQSVMLVWADYYTKLGTAVAARKGPDLGVGHESRLPALVEQGFVIPVDKYVQKSGLNWNEYSKEAQNSVTFDGQKYAVPLDTFTAVVFLNQDKIKAAGVPVNENKQLDIKNAADFKAILDKIKPTMKSGESTLAFAQTNADPYRYWWATYFSMGGTPILSADGKKITLDVNIGAKAADYIKSLFTDGYALPGIADPYKFFQAGSAAMLFGFSWNTGVMAETKGLNLGAQPYPPMFGTEVYWGGSHNLVIPVKQSRSEKDTQAAADFIVWASTKGSSIWAESGQIPANSVTRTSKAYLDIPFRKDYAKAANAVSFLPKDPHVINFDNMFINSLDLIWTDKMSSADAMKNLVTDLSDLIKN